MKRKTNRIIAAGCSLLLLMGIVVPSANASVGVSEQTLRMQKVLEENSTYDGFMNSNDMLSFDEIASLPGAVIGNEYDKIKEIKEQPVANLYAMGMNDDDVNMIKTTDTKEIILDNAATLSDQTLREKGMNADAIKAIRNGNYELISEAETRAVAGQIAVGIASVSRAGESANYNIYWHWDSKPANKWTDTLVGSIDGGYSTLSTCTAKVGYAPMGGTTASMGEDRITPERDENEAIFEIKMLNSTGTAWVSAGKAFVANHGSYLGQLGAHAEYFHSWIPFPHLSIGNGIISAPIDIGTTHKADGIIPAA